MLNERQALILRLLTKVYIETARPVGSSMLVDGGEISVSPATVRNDFTVLESEGYITQPHTSAGRIPTVKGYKFYVDSLSQEVELARRYERQLRNAMHDDGRAMTKLLATLTGESVVWVDRDGRMHYSGVSNLLAQPEFQDEKMRAGMGDMIDQFGDIVSRIEDQEADSLHYVVGDRTMLPSADYSVVSLKIDKGKDQTMVVVLGPLRMNYEKAMALLALLKELYEQ